MSDTSRPSIQQLVEHWNLEPMGTENVLFTQTYLSAVTSAEGRPQYTAIIALMTSDAGSFSDMHRLANDELWHFYLGDPIELLLLHPDGHHELIVLGQNVLFNEKLQHLVPAGTWMGARVKPEGEYSVFGNTMAPGFTENDFELGDRDALSQQWPQHTDLIAALTRRP